MTFLSLDPFANNNTAVAAYPLSTKPQTGNNALNSQSTPATMMETPNSEFHPSKGGYLSTSHSSSSTSSFRPQSQESTSLNLSSLLRSDMAPIPEDQPKEMSHEELLTSMEKTAPTTVVLKRLWLRSRLWKPLIL